MPNQKTGCKYNLHPSTVGRVHLIFPAKTSIKVVAKHDVLEERVGRGVCVADPKEVVL